MASPWIQSPLHHTATIFLCLSRPVISTISSTTFLSNCSNNPNQTSTTSFSRRAKLHPRRPRHFFRRTLPVLLARLDPPRREQTIISELYSVLSDTRSSNDLKAWFDSPLAFEELEHLVYLKAALFETLRLYPYVSEDSKHVIADDVLPDNTFVPAGFTITYSIYSTRRMKSVRRDDYLEFRLERWLSDDGSQFEPPADFFKFVEFNAGPRVCLGKDLAYLQMRSIVASVLLRYHLALVPGHRVKQKMSPRTLHTLHQILLDLQRNHRISTSAAVSELMYTWRGDTQQAFQQDFVSSK